MFKRIFCITGITIVTLSVGFADQTRKKIVLPVNNTNPTNAKQMYDNYCASCHGSDARGSGPVASELKSTPPDLTVLSRQHDGKFPSAHIAAVLRFGVDVPAHGSAAMPVWGRVLAGMDPRPSQITDLRIANLSHYLESIQKK